MVKDVIYLVADRNGVARMTKRGPSLARDEIAVRLTVTIPDGSFRSPVLSATIDVPDSVVMQPVVDVSIEPVQ